jgi:hypothetical protein
MTVGELKKILRGVPDETPVGVGDHFGQMVDLDGAAYFKQGECITESRAWVRLYVPDIGEEPE